MYLRFNLAKPINFFQKRECIKLEHIAGTPHPLFPIQSILGAINARVAPSCTNDDNPRRKNDLRRPAYNFPILLANSVTTKGCLTINANLTPQDLLLVASLPRSQ